MQVGTSDRGNHLHGGPDGFHRRLWELVHHTQDHVELRLVSPHGDQGFPGRLEVTARFEADAESVTLVLSACTDAPTVVNLTSHLYLHLDGHGAGTTDTHLLQVDADAYLPVDLSGIPTGPPLAVEGTPFDLRAPRTLGELTRWPHPQISAARGIDHTLVLTEGDGVRRVATLSSPVSGIRCDLSTDQPGLQVYTGNFFGGTDRTLNDRLLRQGDGIALEPQLFPDNPNRRAFPSAVLRPGETYRHELRWSFMDAASICI